MSHRSTLKVAAADVEQARTIAAAYPGGAGMFASRFSPNGELPVTHYIASGHLDHELCNALADICEINETPGHAPLDVIAGWGLQAVR